MLAAILSFVVVVHIGKGVEGAQHDSHRLPGPVATTTTTTTCVAGMHGLLLHAPTLGLFVPVLVVREACVSLLLVRCSSIGCLCCCCCCCRRPCEPHGVSEACCYALPGAVQQLLRRGSTSHGARHPGKEALVLVFACHSPRHGSRIRWRRRIDFTADDMAVLFRSRSWRGMRRCVVPVGIVFIIVIVIIIVARVLSLAPNPCC